MKLFSTAVKLAGLTSLLALGACQTQETIQREQMMENLSLQLVENQKLVADTTVKIQALEERMGALTGQVQETDQKSTVAAQETMESLSSRLALLEQSQSQNAKDLQEVKSSLASQKEYLDKVVAMLGKLGANESSSKKKSDPFQEAMTNYRKGKYESAKKQLLDLEKSGKYKGSQAAHILHNLGMTYYLSKDYNTAASYFSRLFTEFEKSSYNKNGLLFLAKSFRARKETDKARATLDELIKRYPKSKQATEAGKIKESLK